MRNSLVWHRHPLPLQSLTPWLTLPSTRSPSHHNKLKYNMLDLAGQVIGTAAHQISL